jgi:hypothetical protein
MGEIVTPEQFFPEEGEIFIVSNRVGLMKV